ncbi:AAA family ATPase [Rhizobium calliandrae]|uniref:AAA family ATPase n=1 Tax=Rhizobium calliandrae TaxID=1312182 RepID=UPI003D80A9CA
MPTTRSRKRKASILAIDELDNFGRSDRGGSKRPYLEAVMAGLLHFLDGFDRGESAVVVGARVHPDRPDPAIRASGTTGPPARNS